MIKFCLCGGLFLWLRFLAFAEFPVHKAPVEATAPQAPKFIRSVDKETLEQLFKILKEKESVFSEALAKDARQRINHQLSRGLGLRDSTEAQYVLSANGRKNIEILESRVELIARGELESDAKIRGVSLEGYRTTKFIEASADLLKELKVVRHWARQKNVPPEAVELAIRVHEQKCEWLRQVRHYVGDDMEALKKHLTQSFEPQAKDLLQDLQIIEFKKYDRHKRVLYLRSHKLTEADAH